VTTDSPQSLIWPRILLLAVAALLVVPLTSSWRQPDVPSSIHLLVTFICVVTAVRPDIGLLSLAGFFPMVPAIAVLTHAPAPAAAERLIVAFVVPASLRLVWDRRLVPGDLVKPAAVFLTAATASAIVQLAEQQLRTATPAGFLARLWRHVSQGFFTGPGGFDPLHDALILIESIGAAVILEQLVRRDGVVARSVVRLFVIAGAGLAFFSANRIVERAIGAMEPVRTVVNAVLRDRFNTFYGDINAAASLYALLFVCALWLAWKGRFLWNWIPAALLGLATWLCGSRAAIGGTVAAVALGWALVRRPSPRSLVIVAVLAIAGLAVITTLSRNNASPSRAFGIRKDLVTVSFRLAERAPIFGVGLGSYMLYSRLVIDDAMRARHRGFLQDGENSHNNFLQILAELGLIGFGAFVWLLWPGLRALSHTAEIGAEPVAIALGLVAFLGSCLLGHPLLITHVNEMFFLALGLSAGFAARALPRPPRTSGRLATAGAIALILVLAVSAPIRAHNIRRDARLDGLAIGASADVRVDADGVAYRIAEGASTWFVPQRSRYIEMPLRVQSAAAQRCEVGIAVDGRPADSIVATTSQWTPFKAQLPEATGGRRSRRIDLVVRGAACTLMVGIPETR
jgi:hypothetical protein